MPYSGTLITRVFTSRGQLPIDDATVSVVLHRNSGRQHLLSIQTSNRNGNTTPVSIETPDPQSSLVPNQPDPFTLCDIWVERRGFQLLLVGNVQIFPGVTSIQDLPLIPLPESTGRPAEKVTILPQDL